MSVPASAKKCARSRHCSPLMPGQAQVHLVDEGRGLQRVGGALAAHVVIGEAPQLVIHERHETVQRFGILSRPVRQQLRHARRSVGFRVRCHAANAVSVKATILLPIHELNHSRRTVRADGFPAVSQIEPKWRLSG